MSRTMLFFTALLSFLPLVGIAATSSDAPVVVDEDDWFLITETTPDREFASAHQSFIKRDWQASSAAVRRAAAYVAAEAERAGSASAGALRQTAKDLKDLADRIKAGTESDIHSLDAKFAAAHLALAAHYHELVNRAHAAKHDINAGKYLQRAGDNLQAAAAWSGRKLKGGTAEVAHAAKATGDALNNGGKWAATKTGDLMSRLGASITALGDSLQTKDKARN